jgi:hypothetical protein
MAKRTEFWRWEVWSETGPRKRIKTLHLMTEAQALGRDPTAVRVPGTLEIRDLPETQAELAALTHSGRGRSERKPGGGLSGR